MSSIPQTGRAAPHAVSDSAQLADMNGDLLNEWIGWIVHCGVPRETAKAIARQAMTTLLSRHPRASLRALRPYVRKALCHAWTEFKRRQGSTLHLLAEAEVQRA